MSYRGLDNGKTSVEYIYASNIFWLHLLRHSLSLTHTHTSETNSPQKKTHTHIYIRTYMHACMHAYTHTHTHTPTCIHIYTHTYVHTRTYTHTYTHLHPYMSFLGCCCFWREGGVSNLTMERLQLYINNPPFFLDTK